MFCREQPIAEFVRKSHPSPGTQGAQGEHGWKERKEKNKYIWQKKIHTL